MTNGRVEVITSVEQRRRWSGAEKRRLVAATPEPGASVSAIAREAGIHASQLWGWRRQLRAAAPVASLRCALRFIALFVTQFEKFARLPTSIAMSALV